MYFVVATVQQPKEFKSCRIGELFSYAQFCLQVWTSYIALSYLLNAAAFRSEALCAQGNFCSVFSLILSHVVVALLTIVIMPFRYRRTIDCFNKADYLLRHRLYKRRSGTSPAMTSIVMIVLLWSIAAKIIIGHVGYPVKRYGLYYTYNVAYVGPIILIGIITSLCLVCEQSFADINEHLRHLCWPQQSMIDMTVRSAKLRALMQHHWYVSNFVETLSDCFKLEILLVMVHIYLQLVLFLYLTLWIVFTRQIFDNAFWPCVSGLLEVSIILCKLVYFCYRCDRLVAQVFSVFYYSAICYAFVHVCRNHFDVLLCHKLYITLCDRERDLSRPNNFR